MNVYDLNQKSIVSKELQLRIETVVLECLTQAQKVWGESKVNKIPEIRYDTKGKAAGWSYYDGIGDKSHIRINPILLNENVEYIINQTVPHEMAHQVARMVFGYVKPHGIQWKAVMRVFGKQAIRCHPLSVDTIKAIRQPRGTSKMMKCICPKCNSIIPITRNRATKMSQGWTYRHVECGGRLANENVTSSYNSY
jgi:SprT protein